MCEVQQGIQQGVRHLYKNKRTTHVPLSANASLCRDLLTRHGATHDRDDGKSRPFIKRSDRATQACEACVTAKTKCDDQRPCGRCEAKKLVCQNPVRQTYKKLSFQGGMCLKSRVYLIVPPLLTLTSIKEHSISDAPSVPSALDSNVPAAQMFLNEEIQTPIIIPEGLEDENSLIDPLLGGLPYLTPMQNLFQDIDFETSWDLDLENFSVPQLCDQDPSPQPSGPNNISSTNSQPKLAIRDPSLGHAAFKRYSPWLWEPNTQEDYVDRQKEGLALDEQAISQSSAFDRMMFQHSRKIMLKLQQRDSIFSLVLAQNKDVRKVPSFPTLEFLNFLLHAHFLQDEQKMNSWIHAASLDLDTAMPELLAAIISSGATFISVPAVWRFGLALHEIVRLALTDEVCVLHNTCPMEWFHSKQSTDLVECSTRRATHLPEISTSCKPA